MCRAHRPAASALSELDIGTDEPSEPPDPVGGWPGQPKPGQASHKGRDGPLPGATVPRTGVSAASRGVPYRHCRSTLDVLPSACTTTAAEGHVAPGRDGADARRLAQVVQPYLQSAGVDGTTRPGSSEWHHAYRQRRRSGHRRRRFRPEFGLVPRQGGQGCCGCREGSRGRRGLGAQRRDDQRAG